MNLFLLAILTLFQTGSPSQVWWGGELLSLGNWDYESDANIDDISGTWTWEHTSHPGGMFQLGTMTLTVNGTALTGTITRGREVTLPISHGAVSGETVTFDVIRVLDNRTITTHYSGTVTGNRLVMIYNRPSIQHKGQEPTGDIQTEIMATKVVK